MNSIDNLWLIMVGTVIFIVILFIAGYLGDIFGLVVTTLSLSLLVYLLSAFAHGLGASFANKPPPTAAFDKIGVAVALITMFYLIFLSYGLYKFIAFLKYKSSLTLSFYLWSGVFIIFFVFSAGRRYYLQYNSEIRILERKISHRQAIHLQEQRAKVLRDSTVLKVEELFQAVYRSEVAVKRYLKMSESISKKYSSDQNITKYLANYSTKLLIKMLKEQKYDKAKSIFESYADVIMIHSGFCEKSTDVASNGLVLSLYTKDDSIADKVFNKILGSQFQAATSENEILLFNMACYFSLKKEKDSMLPIIERALLLGKDAQQFLDDSDFAYYWEDADFLKTLQGVKQEEES